MRTAKGLLLAPFAAEAGNRTFGFLLVPGYGMLMRHNKAKTAVHGCHCSGDMAVRMRKILAIPRSCLV